jgi:hypothetical protein
VDYRAKLVPVERERDADRLDRALHPHRSERGEGPVRRRLRELGGVKAKSDSRRCFRRTQRGCTRARRRTRGGRSPQGCAKVPDASPSSQGGHEGTPLRSTWSIRMEGAALGAPTPPAGLHRSARAQAVGRRRSRSNTPACRRAQWSAHRGSSAAPGEPAWPAWLPLSGEALVGSKLVGCMGRESRTRDRTATGLWRAQ